MNASDLPDCYVITFADLDPIFGIRLSRVTLASLEARGLFPPRFRIGVSQFGWLCGSIRAHLRNQQAAAEAEARSRLEGVTE